MLAIAKPLGVEFYSTKIYIHLLMAVHTHVRRYFRSEDTGESLLTIPVGNVTADTELTYEYGVRTSKNRQPAAATATPSDENDEDTPKSKGTAKVIV